MNGPLKSLLTDLLDHVLAELESPGELLPVPDGVVLLLPEPHEDDEVALDLDAEVVVLAQPGHAHVAEEVFDGVGGGLVNLKPARQG